MAPTLTPPVPASPAATWKALAHLIAARPAVRVWNPDTDKFDRTRHLTSRLPQHPAAVLLYQQGRTPLLALDFDTKHHGQDIVDTDFARGVELDHRGRWRRRHRPVQQRRPPHPRASGDRHHRHRCRGQPPDAPAGSPTAKPGQNTHDQPQNRLHYRAGLRVPRRRPPHPRRSPAAAIDVLTTRSEPGLLPRLNMLLGALPAPSGTAEPGAAATMCGAGDHARLDPAYTRTSPLPPRVTDYATTGHLPATGTWRSHSEARQSVLAHAAPHGHSAVRPDHRSAAGPPFAAYTRYHHNADRALERDFTKALAWVVPPTARISDQSVHKN